MATHAIMAYKDRSDGCYYAKFVHYGAYDDARDALVESDGEEFLESILQGNSTEPFDGFYLDPFHSIEDLNWTKKQFIECAPNQIAKRFKSFSEVEAYGKHVDASYIYLWDFDLHVYEQINSQWQDWFDGIDSIEPFNLDNVADFDLKMIVDELSEAYDEVNSFDFDVEDVLEAHQLDSTTIKACKTKEEAIKACERFNAALPEIKKELKERML